MNLQFAQRRKRAAALTDSVAVLPALSALRRDWEAAAEGESLLQVNASVGLLLLDIATNLGLTQEQQKLVLGSRLYHEAVERVQKH